MRDFQSHVISTPDADIACVDSGGNGVPLVLLHGSGASKHVFCRQFSDPALQGFRLIALDLPGHGCSSDAADTSAYTFAGLARSVGSVLGQLAVDNPVLAGWSLGGHVAIEMAASGVRTRGLCLIGTAPLSRGPFGFFRAYQPKLDMLLTAKQRFSSDEAERFANLIFGPSSDRHGFASILRADGQCRARIAKALFHGEGLDHRRFIESADIPIAIINGKDDPLLKQHYFDDLRPPALWRGRCQTIDNAGHACFLDRPEAFSALLSAFLADIERAPVSAPQISNVIAA